MRWTENKTIWLLVLLFFGALSVYPAEGYRSGKPITLKYPITEEQISQLNKYLEDIWFMQKGLYEFDIVSTQKTNAKNGELYFIQTGGTVRIHIKGNNQIYTFTPDGY